MRNNQTKWGMMGLFIPLLRSGYSEIALDWKHTPFLLDLKAVVASHNSHSGAVMSWPLQWQEPPNDAESIEPNLDGTMSVL